MKPMNALVFLLFDTLSPEVKKMYTPREWTVIITIYLLKKKWRYGPSMEEIGEVIGISGERVRQIMRRHGYKREYRLIDWVEGSMNRICHRTINVNLLRLNELTKLDEWEKIIRDYEYGELKA